MIKVENLTKKFHNFIAVDNISFFVREGDIFGFLGPNGAGKTTTIKMLTTLLIPTAGSIFLNNVDVIKDPNQARQQSSAPQNRPMGVKNA